jgi:hypothetical protein
MASQISSCELWLIRASAAIVYAASATHVTLYIATAEDVASVLDYAVTAIVLCAHVAGIAACMSATCERRKERRMQDAYRRQVDDDTHSNAEPRAQERLANRTSLAAQIDQLCIVENPLHAVTRAR